MKDGAGVFWLLLFVLILLGFWCLVKFLIFLFVLWVGGDLEEFKDKGVKFNEVKKNGKKELDNRPFFIQGITRRRKLSLGKKGNVLDGSVLDKWKGHARRMFGGKK